MINFIFMKMNVLKEQVEREPQLKAGVGGSCIISEKKWRETNLESRSGNGKDEAGERRASRAGVVTPEFEMYE